MVITIIADVLGKPNNGTTLAALNLIDSLKSKGHDVRVLCCDKTYADQEGYHIIPTLNFGIFQGYVKKNGVQIAKVDHAILKEAIDGADIVHSILPFSAGRAAARYCLEHNIPFTSGFHAQAENLSSHVFMMNFPLANSTIYRNYWKHYFRFCDAIHYPTSFIRDYVKRYMGGPAAYAISNGVDAELFNPRLKFDKPAEWKDKFVVVMSGRYSTEKKQMLLLKAALMSKHKDKLQIVLAGSGPKEKKLQKFVDRHMKKNPALLKSYKHEELNQLLGCADLYVHTSLIEIEAISCLEALSCGLVPVISNSPRSATSRFALRPESHFSYRSARDLARKIDWWIDHPEERAKASVQYSEFAKQFEIHSCMDRMEQMLIETRKNFTGEKPWLNRKGKLKKSQAEAL
ncbi:MAG TPA: glycosyltransferase [Bacilli bacterium]|nr:glycosyltransferase [Bacilli bacterium]HQA55608.1 glycosyltransferase [Bacilli bacterium]